ncbi:hypothetical protein [Martelella sp. AMO21009]
MLSDAFAARIIHAADCEFGLCGAYHRGDGGLVSERFDVDAIVEIDVPADWDNSRALDILEESLQGFPGVNKIVRCTRCVQLQFPFMHMDVTILDRQQRLAVERVGEIFHAPDTGPALRVPSNPWGFTNWFRKPPQKEA